MILHEERRPRNYGRNALLRKCLIGVPRCPAELEAFDMQLQGWALSPEDLTICTRDGGDWMLGHGAHGHVCILNQSSCASRMCLHCVLPQLQLTASCAA